MNLDLEKTLSRELHDVADGLRVPAMPPLPQEPVRVHRYWQPLLVAASVVLILAGTVAVVANDGGGSDPQPTPPGPTQTTPPVPESVTIPKTAPKIPYVLDRNLYVDSVQVPGEWWSVEAGEYGWLAWRTDYTWWWGRGAEANQVPVPTDAVPVNSPNGKYVAYITSEDDTDVLTGFDTLRADEGLGGVAIDLGDGQDGDPVRVRAVTNDGRVIVQGATLALMWLPLVGGDTVDLAVTAPDQVILGNTPAGLIATDGTGGVVDGTMGTPYLAELSDAGELTPIGQLPNFDDLIVSPDGSWSASAPAGTIGGEVTVIDTLRSQSLDGSRSATLTAPEGWGFRVMAWVWEDDDFLVSPVVRDGETVERMARCSPDNGRCVLITALDP